MRNSFDRRALFIQLLVQACLLCLLTALAQAQSGNGSQQITQSVIAGGGGTSANGSTQVDGTAGQSVTGTSTGGSYTLESGFWSGAAALTPSSLAASDVTGTYGGTVTLTATLTSNSANLRGKLITFTLNGTSVGTANTDSNGVATLNNVSLAGINAGTYPAAISAQFAGDATYAAASATAQLTVQKATPLLQVTGGTFTFDGQPHPASASATGVNNEALTPVTLLYNGSSTVPVNAGTYTVTASFAGNQNYNAVSNSQQSIVINQASQTITFGALANKTYGDADFNVSATASSGLAVSFTATGQCTVTGNTVHITGAGSCSIMASQAGNNNYAAATPVNQSFTMNKATATITLSNLAQTYDGTAKSASATTTPSGLTVNITYSQNGQPVTSPLNAGSYAVSATINDINYQGSASGTLVISQASQTITFAALSNKSYGDVPFTVSATASSGLAITFTSQTTVVCTISGNTVTILSAGTCTIRASQAGNGNYTAATAVDQSFTVTQATSSSTVTASPNPAISGQSVTFTATVSATTGTPTGSVQFKDNGTNLGSPVTLNMSGVATFTTASLSAGTHTITATYSGDTNFSSSTGTLSGSEVISVQSALSINDVSLVEGNTGTTSFTFTVTLSAASTQTVTVNYATADATAATPSDYQAQSGTLTFSPGETTKSITISVNGDTVNEPDETFTVNLSAPINATLAKTQGTATIINDDAPGIQFSTPSYTVNEGDGRAVITVTRSGDLTQAASVNYATSDNAGLTPCNVANGIASQRCDYAITIGRLSFAAGESSKIITIPIIDDSYVEGTETFTITLSNEVGATLGANSMATITINDNDTVAGPSPIDNVAFFVRQQYLDFLNREPEPQGFAGWQNILNNCPSSGVDVNGNRCDRIEVSSDFYRSEEFQQRGYFIYRFYETLGRMPHYAEFMPDMARVSGFLTTMDLETMKTTFVQSFMSRAEFQGRYGSLTDATAYVDALLQAVGLPNHRQRATWIGGLNAGTLSRGDVLRQLIESPEMSSRFYNEAFVVECYFGYLRRDPDSLYTQWLQMLNQTNDYRTLVNGFVNSLEYKQRFGQ